LGVGNSAGGILAERETINSSQRSARDPISRYLELFLLLSLQFPQNYLNQFLLKKFNNNNTIGLQWLSKMGK
jgi:hypothetical protein